MKLLPFDLVRALAGDPVVTRDGREVTQITHFKDAGTEYKVIARVGGSLESFTESGVFRLGSGATATDLFMKRKTIKIGDREVPAPLQVKPEIGEIYYVAHPNSIVHFHEFTWINDNIDKDYFDAGLAYSDMEGASEAGVALYELIKKTMKGE